MCMKCYGMVANWVMKCFHLCLSMLVYIGWKNGFANSLFLSTRACVSTMCDTWSYYMAVCPLVL
ncbi:hypothetical protein F383_34685 [Gossypium arboreum]|uniref:Uncharacterized protein n=1 Tax=Gossypium arboreum TaxID=29729 RepID=A0A0B0MZ66_GOSAR|nr:hypothetical protein F383_34685 [Gossypium arboreum]